MLMLLLRLQSEAVAEMAEEVAEGIEEVAKDTEEAAEDVEDVVVVAEDLKEKVVEEVVLGTARGGN